MLLRVPQGKNQNTLPNAVAQDDTLQYWSPLHEAAIAGDYKRLEKLLIRYINSPVKELLQGNAALHEAAWRGYSRSVRVLCTIYNVKFNCKTKVDKDSNQKTTQETWRNPLLDVQNDRGFSALHLATQNGHNQTCRELLLAGANPNLQNFHGDTALHTACRYGHAGAARILLSVSCERNKQNLNGDTALHISCAMSRRKLTRILVEAGCDLNIHNAQIETPQDIATRKDYRDIVEILINPKIKMKKTTKPPSNTFIHETCKNAMNHQQNPLPYTLDSVLFENLQRNTPRKGEQYYLDLAGHIQIGPIGIKSNCYCAPLFKHIKHNTNGEKKVSKCDHETEII